MSVEINQRVKELTHQSHRDLLNQHLEQIRSLTPSFISSLKIYLIISGYLKVNCVEFKPVLEESVEKCKKFTIKRIVDELNEIIRILQLKTYDKNEYFTEDLTDLKRKFVNESNLARLKRPLSCLMLFLIKECV
jgi:vinculin